MKRSQPAAFRSLAILLTSLLCAANARADDSLARHVPADVGFFVELHDGTELLTALTEPQLWTTLAEFAGQPARPEDADEWRKRIQQTIKMEPAEAIRKLFAQRVAFVGERPGRSQDAVVLCRPPAGARASDLIASFKATRHKDIQRPPTYVLHENIGVAEIDGLLVFGDLLPQNGMFRRVLAFADGGEKRRNLADDAVFKGLLERVPEKPDGVLFARFGPRMAGAQATQERRDPPVSQPPAPEPTPARPATPAPASSQAVSPRDAVRALEDALPELPGPLRDAENVMVAFHRDGKLLHLTPVGDRRAASSDAAPLRGALLLADLPARTLAAWEGGVDYAAIVNAIGGLPPRSLLRVAMESSESSEIVSRLAAALDRRTCLAVGMVSPAERPTTEPLVPAVAWLVRTTDVAAAATELHAILDASVALYTVASLAQDLPPLRRAEPFELEGVEAFRVDLSQALPARVKAAIGELHVCWAMQDGVMIVATHTDWLRQILAARRGGSPRLEGVLDLAKRPIPAESPNVVALQSGPIGDLAAGWLEYFQKNAPQIMAEAWWRKNQPGGEAPRLGIDVDRNPERMRVISVVDGSPAAGWLREGDLLLGANSKRFATTQPWVEMRTAYVARPNGNYFDIRLERAGTPMFVRIPIPFFDGVKVLRRTAAVGKFAQRVVYFDDVPSPAGARGHLTIELRRDAKPLFPEAAKMPETQPAATPK